MKQETHQNESDFLEGILNFIISQTIVNEAGQVFEVRQLVETINNVKLEIFPDEHPPPHFHVTYNGTRASISIYDGSLLKGKLKRTIHRQVMYFLKNHRDKLIKVWNETRPTNCSVGPINEIMLKEIK